MNRILIIEDEQEIREELALLLKNEGYDTILPSTFCNVDLLIAREEPNLVLLDIGLPQGDGFSVCKSIRKHSKVPIIFVTGRDTSMDEVKALSLGGDDYITKPYNIPVLMARIKTVLRRNADVKPEESIEARGLKLHVLKGSAEYEGVQAELTRNEVMILYMLMSKAGEIVSRIDLIEFLWDRKIYIDDNTLSVNITRLRGKLDSMGLAEFIQTRRGMGYKV